MNHAPGKLLFLALTGLLWASSTQVSFSDETYWEKAGELIESGRMSEAVQELDRLLSQRPEDVLLLRLKGICLMEIEREDEAVLILRKAAQLDAENPAVQFYLAKALACRGSIREAIEVASALIDSAPDSPYAEMTERALPRLTVLDTSEQPLDDRKRWNLYADVSTEYDDNVPARSGKDEDPSSTDSMRTIASAAFEYRILDGRSEGRHMAAGLRYSTYSSWHWEEKFRGYDLGIHGAILFLRTGGTLRSMPFTLTVEGNFTHARLDREAYSNAFGARTQVALQWRDDAVLVPGYTFVKEDFDHDTEVPDMYSLDGLSHAFGVDHYAYLLGNRLTWGLGYAYSISRTTGSQFEMDGHRVFTSLSLALLHKMRLSGMVDYADAYYTKYVPDPKRHDHVLGFAVSLARSFYDEKAFLEIGYAYRYSDSKAAFADYERNVFRFSISCYL